MKSVKQVPPKKWQLLCGKDEILSYKAELQSLALESNTEGALDFLASSSVLASEGLVWKNSLQRIALPNGL